MAECHPVGFQWVMEAKRRGATIIHVDPRFTRTSAVADIHVPIRAGSDIAFLGGIIRYIIENERYFREYVVDYTNAPAIISEDFRDTEDLDGLFSGWDSEKTSVRPEVVVVPGCGADSGGRRARADHRRTASPSARRCGTNIATKRCSIRARVFQIVRRHFARYTPEMVEETCGIPRDLFLKVAEALCHNSGRERTSAFCYAVGWTQHTVGVQYIRTAAIIQQLLGNMGRPGGGIMALRGHASIQGSTDIPTLYNLLPGYLPMPKAKTDVTFQKYMENNRADGGWWTEFPKYIVSLMKAWFGEHATRENDWCYDYLPRLTGDHSHMTTYAAMADGAVKGYFVMGENPVVGSMNGGFQREAMRKLDWLVVRDFQLIETAEFWKSAIGREDIATEVFFFPAAAHTEKDGTFTNTQRLLQWHHKAVEPPGDCRSELDFVYELGRRLKELYAGSNDPKDRPIQELTWDAADRRRGAARDQWLHSGRRQTGGRLHQPEGRRVHGLRLLDLFAAATRMASIRPRAASPGSEQNWVAPEWAWAWPMNRPHAVQPRVGRSRRAAVVGAQEVRLVG